MSESTIYTFGVTCEPPVSLTCHECGASAATMLALIRHRCPTAEEVRAELARLGLLIDQSVCEWKRYHE